MEGLLIDRIVEEVIRRIEKINRKKILVLVREDCMRNIGIIESMIGVMKEMDIEVHMAYECIKDENLYTKIYCKGLHQVEFPKDQEDMDLILSRNKYEAIIMNFIRLKEVHEIKNMDIGDGFSSAIFSPVYKGIEIYTDIYEFKGTCKNQSLVDTMGRIILTLEGLNIKMLPGLGHTLVKEDEGRFNMETSTSLVVDKKIITMGDIYGHRGREILINSDSIITAMAEDYIRDEAILVRRR